MIFFTHAHAAGADDDISRLGGALKRFARGLQRIGNAAEVIDLAVKALQKSADRIAVGVVDAALGQRFTRRHQFGT